MSEIEKEDVEEPVDVIADGAEIDRLLNSPVFDRAVQRVRKTYAALWETSQTPAEREACWQRLQVLADVVSALRATRDAGRIKAAKDKHEGAKDAGATPRTRRDGK